MRELVALTLLCCPFAPLTGQEGQRIGQEPDWKSLVLQARTAAGSERELEAEQFISRAWVLVQKKGAAEKDFSIAARDIADFYQGADQWRQVDSIYDEALQIASGDDYKLTRIQLLTGRAFHYFEGERSTRSIEAARRALEIIQHDYGPKSAEAGVGLGLCFLGEVLAGEFELADKTLSEALAVEKPESRIAPVFMEYPVESYDELVKTLGELGSDFYSERGKTDEARDLLRRAASLPVNLETKADIVQRLIRSLEKEGRAEEAQREREQITRELEASTSPDHSKTARQIVDAAAQRTAKPVEKPHDAAQGEVEAPRTTMLDPFAKARDAASAALATKHYAEAAAATRALLAAVARKSRRDRPGALAEVVVFASRLADTPARDDRIVEQVEGMLDVDFGRSHDIPGLLANYYIKTAQSAKAYATLNRWADAVRARMGNDAPQLATVFSLVAEMKRREHDFRGALTACSDWVESERAARGRYAQSTADAYLEMAEIAIDYEDLSMARESVAEGVRIANHWSFEDADRYGTRMKRAAAIYRRLKDDDRADELEQPKSE